MTTISFIGGGNMAAAIIGGLCSGNSPAAFNIRVAEPLEETRKLLEAQYPVQTFATGVEAVIGARAIVLAVKPQIIPPVIQQIKASFTSEQLLISIAAGFSCGKMGKLLQTNAAVIRAMPNTPALIGMGITGMYANNNCSSKDMSLADEILSAVGQTIWVDNEGLMDAVTAVSGSGPAYAFFLIEAMRDAGIEAGLSAEIATALAANTVAGAGQLALTNTADVSELRQQVTSPGGTTAAALDVLTSSGWDKILHRAVLQARDRALELAKEG